MKHVYFSWRLSHFRRLYLFHDYFRSCLSSIVRAKIRCRSHQHVGSFCWSESLVYLIFLQFFPSYDVSENYFILSYKASSKICYITLLFKFLERSETKSHQVRKIIFYHLSFGIRIEEIYFLVSRCISFGPCIFKRGLRYQTCILIVWVSCLFLLVSKVMNRSCIFFCSSLRC